MANTRFKGANASERLTLSTLSDSDMFQTRHLPGTVNDADKGVSKALLQALPVAVCATAAATAAKVGTLAPESCPDFTLVNGRVIHVYFSAANTASVPTINVAGTGAIPITYPNGDYVGAWAAGTTMDLMYISITVDNTAIERWVVVSSLPVDEVALNNMHSVTSNAVAEAGSYSVTEKFTGKYWIDGKKIYRVSFYSATNWAAGTILGNLTNLDTVVDIRDITTFIDKTIYINYLNGGNYAITAVSKTNNNVSVQRGGGFVNNLPSMSIVEYTKTTD